MYGYRQATAVCTGTSSYDHVCCTSLALQITTTVLYRTIQEVPFTVFTVSTSLDRTLVASDVLVPVPVHIRTLVWVCTDTELMHTTDDDQATFSQFRIRHHLKLSTLFVTIYRSYY